MEKRSQKNPLTVCVSAVLQCEVVISNKNSGFDRRRRKEVHVLKVNSSLPEAKLFKSRVVSAQHSLRGKGQHRKKQKKCIKKRKIKKKVLSAWEIVGIQRSYRRNYKGDT